MERSKAWTCSATLRHTKGKKKGQLINDKDSAAGVGILLSDRMEKKVISYGNNGCERLSWVRLEGPSCNIYVICVYMSHRARVKPDQKDVLKQLRAAIKKVSKGDCVVILGDLNEQLPRNIQ